MSETLWLKPAGSRNCRAVAARRDRHDRRGAESLLPLDVSGRKKTKNCGRRARRRPIRSVGPCGSGGSRLDSDARWRRRAGRDGREPGLRAGSGRGRKLPGARSPEAGRSRRAAESRPGSGGARFEREKWRSGGVMRIPHPGAQGPLTSCWRMFACLSPRPSAQLPGVRRRDRSCRGPHGTLPSRRPGPVLRPSQGCSIS